MTIMVPRTSSNLSANSLCSLWCFLCNLAILSAFHHLLQIFSTNFLLTIHSVSTTESFKTKRGKINATQEIQTWRHILRQEIQFWTFPSKEMFANFNSRFNLLVLVGRGRCLRCGELTRGRSPAFKFMTGHHCDDNTDNDDGGGEGGWWLWWWVKTKPRFYFPRSLWHLEAWESLLVMELSGGIIEMGWLSSLMPYFKCTHSM